MTTSNATTRKQQREKRTRDVKHGKKAHRCVLQQRSNIKYSRRTPGKRPLFRGATLTMSSRTRMRMYKKGNNRRKARAKLIFTQVCLVVMSRNLSELIVKSCRWIGTLGADLKIQWRKIPQPLNGQVHVTSVRARRGIPPES